MSAEHLPFSSIADVAEGRSAPDQDALAHLAACASCAADLAWLTRTIGLLRDPAAEDAPAAAVAESKAIFRSRRTQPARLTRALLRFDSARAAPAFGLRADATLERQLLLEADGYEIELRIAPAGERWSVAGQLLGGERAEGGGVELLGATDIASAQLNELQEFVLAPVRGGRYNLTLTLAGRAIVVPGLELGV